LRSLASRAPRASSPSTALATWQASRESPLWVSWRLTPARRSGRWPGSSCPGTAGTPGPATPRRPGAGGSAPSGTGRRRSPGPARGGRGASAKSTANPAQGAAPGRWSGRGRRVLDLTEHDPLQLVRVGPEELIAGPQPGCSAAACSSNSHGPITRWPQPSSGHPHFSHGSPGSWWARSPAGRPRRTAAATPQKNAAVLAFEAGCEDYCEREVDDYLGPERRPSARTARVPEGPGRAWWTWLSSALQHADPRSPARAAGAAADSEPGRGWCWAPTGPRRLRPALEAPAPVRPQGFLATTSRYSASIATVPSVARLDWSVSRSSSVISAS
jgi:hypothetical protein